MSVMHHHLPQWGMRALYSVEDESRLYDHVRTSLVINPAALNVVISLSSITSYHPVRMVKRVIAVSARLPASVLSEPLA